MNASNDNMQRTDDGKLPAHAWPGAYPLSYLTEGGLTICSDCANEEDTSDPVIAQFVEWEGPSTTCDDCGKEMPTAYGEVDA